VQAPQPTGLLNETLPALGIVAEVEERERYNADEMVVQAKELELEQQRVRILQDPTTGAINKRGTQALGALKEADEEWRKVTSDIEATLTNDRQRQWFAKKKQGRYNQMREQIAAHTSAEVRKADAATLAAFADAAVSTVTVSPEKVAEAITDTRTRLVQYSARAGWSPEMLQDAARDQVAKLHTTAIEAFVARDTYEASKQAEAYLKANRGEMTGAQIKAADKLVTAQVQKGEALKESAKILEIVIASQKNDLPPTKVDRKAETTSLNEAEEKSFQEWAKQNGITDIDSPQTFYDYRGYWKDVAAKGQDQRKEYPDGLHFPDTYKQHGHPTFSVESKYSTHPSDGGRWAGEKYVPPGAMSRIDALALTESITDEKVRDKVRSNIREYYADLKEGEAKKRTDAFMAAGKIVDQTGDVSKVPTATWLLLTPTERRGLKRDAERIRHPETNKASDPDLYQSLLNASALNDQTREYFGRLPLSQYRDRLSAVDYRDLVKRQTAVMNEMRLKARGKKSKVAPVKPVTPIGAKPTVAEVVAGTPWANIFTPVEAPVPAGPRPKKMREPSAEDLAGYERAKAEGNGAKFREFKLSVGVNLP
jgi:hypothetical protein